MNIVGVGTIAMDVLYKVNRLPEEDGFSLIEERKLLEGGSAANVVVQASRLGAQCGFFAQLGDDKLGEEFKKGLERENIDTRGVRIKQAGTTLSTKIVVGQEGKKFILLDMGDSFLELKSEDMDISLIRSADIFYTDLLPGEPAIYALESAKKAGLKIVFNLQIGLPLMEIFEVTRDDIVAALKMVDVFAPCRESFLQLTESDNLELGINRFKEMFNYEGLLLLTLGKQGSVAVFDDRILKTPSFKVEVQDTTGAGDSFIGSFMYAYYIRKLDLKKAMRFASAAAALTCTRTGARTSPELKEVLDILNK